MAKKHITRKKRLWTPFVDRTGDFDPQYIMDGIKGARAMGYTGMFKIFENNIYQVNVHYDAEVENFPAYHWLSVKRLDKSVIVSWRDMQRIKNELVGDENEAVQLFPAESRLIDETNQYHFFVFADPEERFPFGYWYRSVMDGANGGFGKAKQEPFFGGEVPADMVMHEAQ